MAVFMVNCSNPVCVATGRFIVAGGGETLRCSACREAVYCSKECQRAHWSVHKKQCKIAKLFRLAFELTRDDKEINTVVKESAQCKSNVDNVAQRRAVVFDFPDVATLEAFVCNRGRGVNVSLHHFSPEYCEEWVSASERQKGGVEDCLSVESITLKLVRSYDPALEAVVVLRMPLDSTKELARAEKMRFLH